MSLASLIPVGTVAEIAARSPSRKALTISTTNDVMIAFGLVDAAVLEGIPLSREQGPLTVTGKMAADRWTAFAFAGDTLGGGGIGDAVVGVLEHF